jgi:hypothetical protein
MQGNTADEDIQSDSDEPELPHTVSQDAIHDLPPWTKTVVEVHASLLRCFRQHPSALKVFGIRITSPWFVKAVYWIVLLMLLSVFLIPVVVAPGFLPFSGVLRYLTKLPRLFGALVFVYDQIRCAYIHRWGTDDGVPDVLVHAFHVLATEMRHLRLSARLRDAVLKPAYKFVLKIHADVTEELRQEENHDSEDASTD